MWDFLDGGLGAQAEETGTAQAKQRQRIIPAAPEKPLFRAASVSILNTNDTSALDGGSIMNSLRRLENPPPTLPAVLKCAHLLTGTVPVYSSTPLSLTICTTSVVVTLAARR